MNGYYDLLIIGAGPGGYTAALKAARLGLKVAVIDQDKIGGVCLNRGCIPTKALLYASHIFSMMQRCDEFGVSTDFISFDFGKMQDYKKRAVKKCRDEIEHLFELNRVTFIRGTAVIGREKTVAVRSEDGMDYLRGGSIIIATGAKPAKPDIPGIDLPGVINSDHLLTARHWSFDRIVIIGGGVIGVEFAAIFQALCSKVTIVEKGPHLLGPMDSEVAMELEAQLRARGIMIYCNSTVEKISGEDGLSCVIERRLPPNAWGNGLPYKNGGKLRVKANQVIVAAGRKPYTEGLFGKGIAPEYQDGRLAVDRDFMTSEPGIYAIGDVVARTQLAHVAAAQGTYVVEKIAGVPHSIKLAAMPDGINVSLPIVPNCIYTEPEIATVGITRQTADELGMKVRCGVCSMDVNGKSIITREEGGFIRLIFEASSDKIVGAQMVCPRATDMIGEMATAIANGLTARQLNKAMRAHPTYSEGIAAAIEDASRHIQKGEKIYE